MFQMQFTNGRARFFRGDYTLALEDLKELETSKKERLLKRLNIGRHYVIGRLENLTLQQIN